MAINPVALGVQVPKFDNPMEIYGNALKLQSMQQQNALAQSQMADLERERSQNAFLNDAYSRAIDPQTGKVNYNALSLYLAHGGQGSLVPGIRQAQSAEMKADFEAREADDKVIKSELNGRLAALESFDPKDPNLAQRLMAWRQGTQGNAHLQAWMQSHGIQQPTDEQYAELIKTPEGALQQYNESLRSLRGLTGKGTPKIEFQTTNRGIEGINTNPESSGFGQTVIQRGAPPRSPGVTINTGDKGFGKVLGEDAGKDLTNRYNTANSASESYQSTNNLYQFVNNPDFISGSMGDWRAKAAKFLGLPGVPETDAYFAQVGKEVGQEVKQFGAGTGISEGDRKYAAEIAAGSRELTPEGIRLIMYARQMLNRYKIRKYNERREFLDRNNPDQNIAGFYEEIPVPPPPAFNGQGWSLHRDKNGNYAYVGPGKNQVQEVK